MAAIDQVAVWVPPDLVPVSSLPERASFDEQDLAVVDSLGISTVAESGLPGAELAANAAGELINAGVDPEQVDALIVVQGRVPEMLMTSEATRVQSIAGLAKAPTFSVGDLGCVSINAALAVGSALVNSGGAKTVMLVHGSKPPAPKRYRKPVTINGEGGIAMTLTADGPIEIVDSHLESNGEYWDLYRVDYKDKPEAEWVEEAKSLKTYSFQLAVESRNRFRAINEMILERNGLALGNIQHFVMQNLSLGAFRFYEELLGITFARACYDNLGRYGHLGSMDIVLNLKTGIDSGEFSKGDQILVMNNSPVAAWASLLIRIR
ncbi:MAG TPA: 3-oxoacyl-[acyl-carrier-protein] synthase III C-terminal domain-containing protein [Actinomycetota bacterium]|nr:3-oxoacyl-[acyl-carrier-protein] synthase III C-terminal domain-containing protein [Actinomycetota bacterium]